jgi:lysophospholipase L1-like esterase
MKALIDSAIGLVLAVLIFVVLDLIIGATGMGDPLENTNWSRGFDTNAQYIVPDPEVEGAWITQFRATGRLERPIPPKTEKQRVLLFGGSNTAGFSHPRMTEILNDAAGEKGFYAVQNLGREGYGSTRVRIVFEQAIKHLEPDIVIIYAGHNEFVEMGFQMDLEAAGISTSQSSLQAAARDTNLFRALVRAYAPDLTERSEATASTRPEEWAWEYAKFKTFSYDQTLRHFEHYADNLRSMCQSARDRGIEVLICTVVHNRMAPPFSSTFPKELTEKQRSEYSKHYIKAMNLRPAFLEPLLPLLENERVHQKDYRSRGPYQPEYAAELESQRPSHGYLADKQPQHHNRQRWKPAVVAHDKALLRFYTRDFDAQERLALEQAEVEYKAALAIVPDHPRALFELAMVSYLLERDDALVTQMFEDAARFDRAPRKANAHTNDLVLQVASEIEGVRLLDTDRIFRESQQLELVGWEWMADHCHVNRGGGMVIMQLMAEAVLEHWPVTQTEDH